MQLAAMTGVWSCKGRATALATQGLLTAKDQQALAAGHTGGLTHGPGARQADSLATRGLSRPQGASKLDSLATQGLSLSAGASKLDPGTSPSAAPCCTRILAPLTRDQASTAPCSGE